MLHVCVILSPIKKIYGISLNPVGLHVTFILNNERNCRLYIQHQSDSDTTNISFQINKHWLCRCASTLHIFMSCQSFHAKFLIKLHRTPALFDIGFSFSFLD